MVTRDSSLRPLTFWNLDGVRLGKVCNLKSNIFFILLYFSNNTKGFRYILTKTDFRKFDSLKLSMFSSISWKWLKLNGNQMCIWVAYWFFFSMKLWSGLSFLLFNLNVWLRMICKQFIIPLLNLTYLIVIKIVWQEYIW